jgi:nitrite reductase/ring-hydroxylating ferredoxin subunit
VWHRLGSISALFAEGDCHGTEILGRKIGLFRVAGIVYAIDDICTHGNARLSEGELDGFEVECPLHAGLVDIRTGKALCSPLTRDTQAHHVRLVDGQVDVRLEYGV